MKKIIVFIIVITSIFQLSGCSTPETTVKRERIIPVNRILKRIEANRRKVKFFYGTGVLNISSPKFSGKANFEVWIKKPDSIKISVFGPFGLDVGELLVTNNGYKFYDAFKNVLYVGKDKNKVIKKFFNTKINFGDMIDAFAGSVNLSDKLNETPGEAKETEDDYLFIYPGENSDAHFKIEKDKLSIVEYKLVSGKEIELQSSYTDFDKVNSILVPHKILIKYPKANANVNIDYREIEVNEDISKMDIEILTDTKVIEL